MVLPVSKADEQEQSCRFLIWTLLNRGAGHMTLQGAESGRPERVEGPRGSIQVSQTSSRGTRLAGSLSPPQFVLAAICAHRAGFPRPSGARLLSRRRRPPASATPFGTRLCYSLRIVEVVQESPAIPPTRHVVHRALNGNRIRTRLRQIFRREPQAWEPLFCNTNYRHPRSMTTRFAFPI